jgi:hypothetical protein
LGINIFDQLVGPDVAHHFPAYFEGSHGVHNIAPHLLPDLNFGESTAEHLSAWVIGGDGFANGIGVLQAGAIGDDGIELAVIIAHSDPWKRFGEGVSVEFKLMI